MDKGGKLPDIRVRGTFPGVGVVGDLIDVVGYAGQLAEELWKLTRGTREDLTSHDELSNMGAGREAGDAALPC